MPSSKDIFKEVAVVYIAVIAAIIALAVGAIFIPFLSSVLFAIVALLFYFIPTKLLEKKKLDEETFGLRFIDYRRNIAYGMAATIITLPLFLGGFWFWKSQILEQKFDWSPGKYSQWSAQLQGEPKQWRDNVGVYVWSKADVLRVGIRNDGSPNNRVTVKTDGKLRCAKTGIVKPTDGGFAVTLSHSKASTICKLSNATSAEVSVAPITDGNEAWVLYEGPTMSQTSVFDASRGFSWLFLWIATQFLLIAFPEEFFYRGYMQTRLDQAFSKRDEERGTEGRTFLFSRGTWVASLAFGLGHLFVPVGGVLLANRIMVFFPSLIFGWLRIRTRSILSSTIYHACCNLMVLIGAVHFS